MTLLIIVVVKNVAELREELLELLLLELNVGQDLLLDLPLTVQTLGLLFGKGLSLPIHQPQVGELIEEGSDALNSGGIEGHADPAVVD